MPGQPNLKKVVCEMGGKNALIIDNDADLDEAIPAALYSAFGFSGQKCSALSRLIVLDEVYDHFVERFLAACPSVPVGDPAQPGTIVGPVIDADAQKKILGFIELGKKEAKLAFQGQAPGARRGLFVPPTVFADVQARTRHRARGNLRAGARHSAGKEPRRGLRPGERHRLRADRRTLLAQPARPSSARSTRLLVGNLYLNRGITGAIVERHPFGGFKMSGGGTKAGGKDYLENFLFPRVVAENVMRRGFTPPA